MIYYFNVNVNLRSDSLLSNESDLFFAYFIFTFEEICGILIMYFHLEV